MNNLSSTRTYRVVIAHNTTEDLATVLTVNYTLEQLLNDDSNYEYVYVLWDEIDGVLNLQKGEQLVLEANRDVDEGLMIVTRTN